ncbi:MAG: GEVED domain-containing protein, partial [Sphingobacteriales bacterium]|nr:GEVED domain-containing protein [Sphingobacteriales bacterium]
MRFLLSGLIGLFAFFVGNVQAQVTVSNPGNTTPALNATYPSLAGAVTALNACTAISGPVVITLNSGNSQTCPSGGYSITATLSGASNTNRVTFEGSGNTITAPNPAGTVGNLNDAIFKVIGSDFITIQNFIMTENALNTVTAAGTNTMVEWGVAVLYGSTTNGAQNIIIQNNTIDLIRTYQNTFGIYSNATHSATTISTSATATTTAGSNSDLKIYGNTITDVNNGIVVVGPTAAADFNTGVDIGGTGGAQSNTISNYGTTGTFSSYANVSGTVNGILMRNSIGYNISFNSISSSNGGTTVGTLRGIYNISASIAPVGTYTNAINNNTIALTYGVASGTMQGITVEATTSTATSSQTINNNNFTSLTASIASSVTITAISTVATHLSTNINSNTLTNITTNTTGSFTFINAGYTIPAGGTQNINGNSIVTALNKTGAGGTVAMLNNTGTSIAATAVSHSNNNFSNITVTGATTLNGISSTDGLSTIAFGRTVNGNTFSNWTGGTSALSAISYSYVGGNNGSISSNTISNLAGQGAITGITITSSGNAANPLNISSNTITGLSSTGTGGTVQGIFISSNTSPLININNNNISGLASVSLGNINGIQTVSTGTAAQTVNIFKNRICDIANNGPVTNQWATGIFVTGTGTGTVVNVHTNVISNLRAPNGTGQENVNGLTFNSSAGTINASYNTVYLDAVMNGGGGSNAVYSNVGSTQTFRNNIFYNNSTIASGSGFAIAYRRSSAALTNYGAASNNNLFFVGTPGGSRAIFYDGVSPAAPTIITLANYKTYVGPARETNSISVLPNFLSTNCGNANFLRIDPAITTQIESGGTPVAGITDDIDGNTRNASTPDIGADEFNGTTPAPSINNVTIPTATCTVTGHVINANITTAVGTISTVTINYNNGSVGSVPMTLVSGNTYTGTIPPGTAGTTVTWSITATNDLPISTTFNGVPYTDDPLATSTATATATPTSVCSGAASVLNAALITPNINVTVGAGATSISSYNAPFYSLWSNKHQQILIKASELTAAGLAPGLITEISFPTTSGTISPLDFTVKLANSSVTDMSAFVTTGLTQVYFLATQPQVANTNNTLVLNTPFNWTGSNLVIDICFGNSGSSATLSSTSPADNTSYISVIKTHTSAATSSTVACPDITSQVLTYSVRPRIIFKGFGLAANSGISWSDGSNVVGTTNPLTVNPLTATTYTAAISALGCTKISNPVTVTTISLDPGPTGANSIQCGTAVPSCFVAGAANGQYRWYTVPVGGTAIPGETGAGLNTLNGGTNTYTISSTTTFYVSINTGGPCETARTAVVATVSAPDPIAASSNGPVCANSPLQLTATITGGANNNNYAYTWTAAPATGSGIPSSVSGGSGTIGNPSTVTVTPTIGGTYIYTLNALDNVQGCATSTTVSVNIISRPVIDSTKAAPTAVCAGAPVTLNVYSAAVTTGPQTQPSGYCAATFSSTTEDDIGQVRFGTSGSLINNPAVRPTPQQSNAASVNVYTDFTGTVPAPTITAGSTYPMTIYHFHSTTNTTANFVNVYIDFNRNGVFTDAGETFSLSKPGGTFLEDFVGNITIPSNATPGVTRMRVIVKEGAITTPCSTVGSWGEAEDYLVNIQGVVAQNPALTYAWNNGITATTPTASINPITTTTYQATVTNGFGCSSTSNVTVTVNLIPANPSTTGSDQCGTVIPTASVSSNSGETSPIFKWYTAASGGTAVQTNVSTTYLSTVGTTTTFYVSEITGFGCESGRTPVTITVSSPDPLTVTSSTGLTACVGETFSLSSSYTPDFNTFATFDLTATGGAASGVTGTVSLTANGTGSDPFNITPTAIGTYIYTITANDPDKGCTSIASITITVAALPPVNNATATPSTVCAGQPALLAAQAGAFAPGFGTIGTQTTTIGGNDGNPYRSGNGTGNQIRNQILVTAAELTAAGFTSGNLTSLGFTTTGIGGTVSNFTIDLALTSVTSLSTTFETSGFSTVFTLASLTTVLGLNTHVFQTPFFWDGTSNIVINTCQTNAVTGTNTVAGFTPAFSSNLHRATSTTSCTTATGTLVAAKPIVTFGGQVGTNNTANYNWTWNPGNINAGTTGTTTVNPLTTTIYTATATDPVTGCEKNSLPVTVTVNPLPAAPGSNSPVSRCGTGPVSLTATGTGGSLKWYNVATGGTSLQNGASYSPTVTGSTSFWVAETSAQGCEGPRTQVIVTVTAAPTLVITPSGSINFCNGGSVALNAASASSSSYVNFTWSPATGLSATTGPTVTANPNVTTTYTVTANDGLPVATGCASTATITVTVNPKPVVSSVTATPSTICAGQSSQLEAKSNIGSPLSVKIGTGTTGYTGAANPYWWSAEGSKGQNLYLAADLIAGGYTAGPIDGLSFNVTALPTLIPYFNNFKISLAQTTATALTTVAPQQTTGFQQVYGPINYTTVLGTNTHLFSTPFIWDGVSNIIVQTCYDNDPNNTCASGCSGTSATIEYTASTPYVASNYYYGANTSDPNRDFCTTPTGTFGSQSARPNATFIRTFTNNTGLYNWQWTPGGATTAITSVSPATTTTYTATATDPVSGCTTTSAPVTLTVNAVPSAPVTNGPITKCGAGFVTMTATNTGGTMNWYNVATGGTSIATGNSYTPTVTGSTSFWVAETYFAGCEGPRTEVAITITSAPALTITASASATICQGGNVGLTASGTGFVNFIWSPSAGLSATNTATVTANPTSTTTYTVVGDDGIPVTGCSNLATITITVNPNPVISSVSASATTVCAGGSSVLSATSLGSIGGNLFAEPFETFPVANFTTTGTGVTWTGSSSYFIEGAGAVQNTYIASADGSLAMAASVNLVGTVNPKLKFSHIAALEGCCDYGKIEYSLDNGATWIVFPSSAYAGAGTLSPNVAVAGTIAFNRVSYSDWNTLFTSSTIVYPTAPATSLWKTETINLSAYNSATSFRIRFRLTSDVSVQYAGWKIDDVKITTDAADITNTLNWTWNPGNLSGASVTVNPTTTTTYTVTATNPLTLCNSSSAPLTVNVAPVAAIATASPSTPVCAGSAVTLSAGATGGGPFTYAWASTPAGTYAATGSIVVNPTVTTSYTVTVTDACGNTTTSSVTVTVNPLPTVTVTPATASFCIPGGTPATLTASGATSYAWLPATGLSATTGSVVIASPTVSTIYTVTGTDGNGCVNTATAAITVNPNVTAPTAAANPTTICAGSTLNLTSSATLNGPVNGYSMNTNSGVAFVDISATGTSVGVVTDDSEHNISIPSFDFNGTTYTTARVGANGAIVFGSTTGDVTVTNAALPSTTNTAGNSFLSPWWDDLDVNLGGTIKTQTVGNLFIIQYTGMDHNLFTTGTVTFEVQLDLVTKAIHFVYQDVIFGSATYDAGLTATVGIQRTSTSAVQYSFNTASLVNGQSISFIPTYSALPITFLWSGPGGFTSTQQNPTATATVNGTYSVIFTSSAGCSATASTNAVTVNPRPTAAISGGAIYCSGQGSTSTTLNIALTGTGPWNGTVNPGNIPFSSVTNSTTITVTPLSTTTYSIGSLTDASSCTPITADLTGSATITINPTPATPTITAGGPTTFCSAGGSVVLTSSATTGNQWSLDGTPIPGATNQTLNVTASGSYTVITTSGAGCSSTASVATVVTVNPTPATPTITAGGPTTFCSAGGSVVLTSSATTGNQWSLDGTPIPGAINQTLNVTASGSYTVITTSGAGCSSTASAATVVTVNPTPATPVVAAGGSISFCAGGSVTLSSNAATGNQWYLNGSPISGQTGTTLLVNASGSYTVVSTSLAGCPSATSNAIVVTVNPLAANPTATVTQPTCAVATGTITVTAPLGAGNSYTLDGTTTITWPSVSFSAVAPGVHTISVS